jgi:hypothetical protein
VGWTGRIVKLICFFGKSEYFCKRAGHEGKSLWSLLTHLTGHEPAPFPYQQRGMFIGGRFTRLEEAEIQ